jgi:hypothetical protein
MMCVDLLHAGIYNTYFFLLSGTGYFELYRTKGVYHWGTVGIWYCVPVPGLAA